VADASKINLSGWHQGSVLPGALADPLGAERVAGWGDGSVLVVLTQDCDLVHPSYEVEPNVELIAGAFVDAADNGLRHGRNPRRLHVDVDRGGGRAVVAFSVQGRLVVPRSALEEHAPHPGIRLGREDRRLLCEWVAKRYVRAAFPDAFNERAQAAHRTIEKALKRGGEHVTGLFLMIEPDDECASGQDYRIILRVTARAATLADETIEVTLVRLAKAIADALAACDGVLVEDHQLVSEAEFTLEDLRFFKRWDWDYRSHSGEPGGEVAPTG
jgi:hypothetical protein